MAQKRVAVVTGASSGIGDAVARRLAAVGFRVFGASRRAPAEPVSGIEHVTIDVDDDSSVRTGVADVLHDAGRIDLLVNNAGYLCAGAVEEISIADAKAQFETNYFGVVRMICAVLPGMRERRRGQIITVSSLAGLVPVPYWGQYNASKFAVEGLMETLRYEVRPFGIKVSMVEPGNIKTPFYARPQAAGMDAYAGPRGRAFAAMAEYVRNKVTKEATQFTLLRWVLPSGAFESGVRRAFRLEAKGEAKPQGSVA